MLLIRLRLLLLLDMCLSLILPSLLLKLHLLHLTAQNVDWRRSTRHRILAQWSLCIVLDHSCHEVWQ
jgi:hypothetical protein